MHHHRARHLCKAFKVRYIPLDGEAVSVVRVRAKSDRLMFPDKDGAPMTDKIIMGHTDGRGKDNRFSIP